MSYGPVALVTFGSDLGNFREASLVCWVQTCIGLKGWLSCMADRD